MKFRKLVFLSLFSVSMGFIWGCGDDEESPLTPGSGTPIEGAYSIKTVRFSTSDDLTISGGWTLPKMEKDKFPAVILLHSLRSDRDNWILSSLWTELLEGGYAVLRIDLRGHGESQNPGGRSCDFLSCTLTIQDLENTPLDVKGALDWLFSKPEVDTDKIALIGEDIGANVAYVSSGSFSGIKTAVLISPVALQSASTGETILIAPRFVGADAGSFNPRSILFVASQDDSGSVFMVDNMLPLTSEPRGSIGISDTNAHGIATLAIQGVRNAIIMWLKDRLAEE